MATGVSAENAADAPGKAHRHCQHRKRIAEVQAFPRFQWQLALAQRTLPTLPARRTAIAGISTNQTAEFVQDLYDLGWLVCRKLKDHPVDPGGSQLFDNFSLRRSEVD